MATEKDVVFSEVPDMSVRGDHRGQVITALVGPERRCFEIHLLYLGDIILQGYDEESDEMVVEFPDEDPRAFNLLMDWQYNRAKLPRVPDLSRILPML
ncbi:hypothetical protein UCREL1_8568 [Eutypa lata UCREL1]|uniref:BTB domain-containing protein n=1 Tax=Eutypa lata (strain UCR-EL1) TaxID=1287681 RepID=M7SJH3_EUTLA|nr:hypothetical protein UCREL1_8568 [Eutypa lata UCREL1]